MEYARRRHVFRRKKSGDRSYLQTVENRSEEDRSKQPVVCTVGAVGDQLEFDHKLGFKP